jgi:hypothetical protein
MSTLTMSETQVRAWVADNGAILEGRSATINAVGHIESISRGTFGILQYSVTDDKGTRTGRNRDQVMSTLRMTEAQVRAWGADNGAWLEARTVTINALGHTETISRGSFGIMQYTVTDAMGSRTGRNRDQVVATLTMTEAQVRAWGADNGAWLESRTVTINQDGHTETINRGMFGIMQYSITDARGTRTGRDRDNVVATLGMNEAQLRVWGEAAAGVIEGRSLVLNQDGYVETINRGMFGILQYTVTDEKGSRTGRNRDSVIATLGMSQRDLRTWAEDRGAHLEGRSATINVFGHTETISRGMFGILQYTVTDDNGSRTGRNRSQVLSTLTMSEVQVRAWVADQGAWLEGRSVTINAVGHNETISRGTFGVLQYSVTDDMGTRTGRSRDRVLSTLTMNEAQVRAWVADTGAWLEARTVTINAIGHNETITRGSFGIMQYTVTDAMGSRTGRNRDQVVATLGMTEAQVEDWAKAAAGVVEGRSTTMNRNGYTETINRGMLGIVQYAVTNARGTRSGRDRASVVATLGMNETQLRTWGEAASGVIEGRSLVLNQAGHMETISRGMFGVLQYTVTDEKGSRTGRIGIRCCRP